jgi:hypothetical protein
MALSRRDFLNRAALAGGGDAADRKYRHAAHRSRRPRCSASPSYGPLVADPAGRLGLPSGSQYTIVTQAGETTRNNITVSPYGGLLLAEDGASIQHPVGGSPATAGPPAGTQRHRRQRVHRAGLSLDRRVLFANLQSQSTMFAITGPWRRQPTR